MMRVTKNKASTMLRAKILCWFAFEALLFPSVWCDCAKLTIDTFTDDQAKLTGITGTPASSFVGGAMLGQERDIKVTSTGIIANAEVTGGALEFSTPGTGFVEVVYDGQDGLPAEYDYIGLGDLDLTLNNQLQAVSFRVILLSGCSSGTMTLSMYSDGTNGSDNDQTFPASCIMYFTLASFATVIGGGVDFTDIGLVELKVVGDFSTVAQIDDFAVCCCVTDADCDDDNASSIDTCDNDCSCTNEILCGSDTTPTNMGRYAHGGLNWLTKNVPCPADCKASCESHSKCVHWSFKVREGQCKPFDSTAAMLDADPDWVSSIPA